MGRSPSDPDGDVTVARALREVAPMKPWLDESIAPNGRTVRENFLSWFSGSAIVDNRGEPLMLAHGSRVTEPFDVMLPSVGGAQGPGIYMSQLASGEANEYGLVTYPLYARIVRPFVFHPSDDSLDAIVNPELLEALLATHEIEQLLENLSADGRQGWGSVLGNALARRGHDGIVMVYPHSRGVLQGHNVVIATSSHQVKSAIGNSGLFDPLNPSFSDKCGNLAIEPHRPSVSTRTLRP